MEAPMKQIRLLMISILAALAITAIATTTASAASFSVETGASALLLETVVVTENSVLTASGQPEIECSKISVRGGHFENGSSTATPAVCQLDEMEFAGVDVCGACQTGVQTIPVPWYICI